MSGFADSTFFSGGQASAGRTIYRLGFEISPIVLTNGLAGPIGGFLPIVALLEAANFTAGLLSGTDVLALDNFFAHFRPIPGATLARWAIGNYPFANQTVAANAVIAEPLQISLQMDVPVNKPGGNTAKFVTFMALKETLDQHVLGGGTFTVATPTYLYTNCILTALRDISHSGSAIPQSSWQFDFIKPLITLAEAAAAQSTLMNKVTNGVQTDGSISGPPNVPNQPFTQAAPSVVQSAQNTVGASSGGFIGSGFGAAGGEEGAVVPGGAPT